MNARIAFHEVQGKSGIIEVIFEGEFRSEDSKLLSRATSEIVVQKPYGVIFNLSLYTGGTKAIYMGFHDIINEVRVDIVAVGISGFAKTMFFESGLTARIAAVDSIEEAILYLKSRNKEREDEKQRMADIEDRRNR